MLMDGPLRRSGRLTEPTPCDQLSTSLVITVGGWCRRLVVEDESLDGVSEPRLVAVVGPSEVLGEDLGDVGAVEHQQAGGRVVGAEAEPAVAGEQGCGIDHFRP